ncbi:MAG: acetyl-CoA carboxylase biotin carboxylase subunit [Rhodospirillaceae bacterium]|nr:acetyl-CoA carboxylase biotin carboxylase subunit [Rhodospirillaceae bacterium]MYH38410.1 acetyl-CoA carboxylase biotin carboxylase subunit [Rhodospirillaceae bacterium]MYK15105.1 acetyl-CoA carboxylase biotin carboxylase subunit [Rhodospirillaceae bacterium]
MRRFGTILVANRGEIAVRVMRTARALGYRTVAVHSEADSEAPHVRIADAAAHIGPPPAAESYLNIDNILRAAAETGADAVHPGYGFLSENAAFARACADAGLSFIGPDAGAIALMGDKAEARRRMADAGVPCVPGYDGADQSNAVLAAAAAKIGFPVMVKAAAGGGGRGMRLVAQAGALPDALAAARSEAENAFGSGNLILEKAIARPRHVEIQIVADSHGNTIHLGERDCSVQRRHQKVIEEAPCPVMTGDLREAMGAAAVEAARSIGYCGAGTVEFLLDADGSFYFLEMNTRLQVEHPVTEAITGLDLVALQIRVAEGRPLGLAQADFRPSGHAIEARLYAEDVAQDFLPAAGDIALWRPPAGPGVRIDSGVESGQAVSPFYDPMIAKIVAHGETRDIARRRLIRALAETVSFGLTTNRRFLIDCLERDAFARGEATTAFIEEQFGDEDLAAPDPEYAVAAAAAVLKYLADRDAAYGKSLNVSPELLDWASAGALESRCLLTAGDADFDLSVSPAGPCDRTGPHDYTVRGGDEAASVRIVSIGNGRAELAIDGVRRHFQYHAAGDTLFLGEAGRDHRFGPGRSAAATQEDGGGGRVVAPMHGKILEIAVDPGDTVNRGDRLMVIEAMKMQHDIVAPAAGAVADILQRAGVQVAAGDPLVDIAVADRS